MRRFGKISKFYREHPWSTVLVVIWIASTIFTIDVWTGTQAMLGLSTGQLYLAWMPPFMARANPSEVQLLPAWYQGWEQFVRLKVRISGSSAFGTFTGLLYLPAWLFIALPRMQAVLRNIIALRRALGIPCSVCGYDLSNGTSVCSECGGDAPVVRPSKRAIIRQEFQIFCRLVIAPLGVMIVMALISTMLYEE